MALAPQTHVTTHGDNMPRLILATVVLAATLGIGGCAGQTRAEKVGTVGGAVAGGAVGRGAGGGPPGALRGGAAGGGTLGTLGGAAAGGYIGNKAGDAYDKKNH